MYKAVDRRQRHRRSDKDFAPLRERRVRSDRDTAALVALGDQFEEDGGLGLIAADIAEIVEDQEIETIELGQLLGKAQVPPCCL